jgi:hypothetical protein
MVRPTIDEVSATGQGVYPTAPIQVNEQVGKAVSFTYGRWAGSFAVGCQFFAPLGATFQPADPSYLVSLALQLEATNMPIRTTLTVAILVSACFAAANWSESRASQPFGGLHRLATQTGSVSGKISAVGTDSFSVDVQKSQEPVTLKFLIDANTKIDGNLKVGAGVTVDYRSEDVNNIAVHVVVHPAAAYYSR